MSHVCRIAANSFREALREPVYFLMLIGALLLIGHYPWMTLFVFREQLKLVVDGAMATTLFFSLAVCVLCASYTIAREMRNGTVLLLLSKPISRWGFVVGKMLGIIAAALLFCGVCCCSSVIAVYIAVDQFRMDMLLYGVFFGLVFAACVFGMIMNFLRGSSFSEYAVYAAVLLVGGMTFYCCKWLPEPKLVMLDLWKALLLIAPAVLIMSVLAVGFATRFDVVPCMCMCSLIFFLGLISSYLFAGNVENQVLAVLYSFLYAALPNWQYFWMADAIAVNRSIPGTYVWWSVVYALIYSLIVAAWAVALFQNREAAGSKNN